jgi:ubiquinone biosynthesis protein
MLGFKVPPREQRSRYRRLVSVLGRHGMGAASNRLGIGWLQPFSHSNGTEPSSTPEHVRLALEELGTTAIKLGQILSTRPDIVSPEIIDELTKLHQDVPPAPTEDILRILEQELGRSVPDIFRDFNMEPLASASIGQVYAATLPDGTPVVVKVRKPGVEEMVETDLAILEDLADRAAGAGLWSENYDIQALAREFSWTLQSELDYVREGQNADHLREVLIDEPRAVVPQVYWDLTTSAVLVMERLDGVHPDEIGQTSALRGFAESVAEAIAQIWLKQIFEAGFFHADPHPGNLLILEDGRVGLLDFGMVGQLGEETKFGFLRLLNAAVHDDATTLIDCLDELGAIRSASDRDSLTRETQVLLDKYYGVPATEFSLTDLVSELQGLIRRHHVQLPSELALVLKAIAMSEGICRSLDPEFNFATVAEPFVKEAAASSMSPSALSRRIAQASGDALELATYLPGQIRRIARRIDRGEFEIALRHRDLDETVERMSAVVMRLSTAIVIAALLLATTMVTITYRPPGWDLLAPVWFFGSLTMAGILTVRLILSERRRH